MRMQATFLPDVAVGTVIGALILTVGIGLAGTWRILGQKAAPVSAGVISRGSCTRYRQIQQEFRNSAVTCGIKFSSWSGINLRILEQSPSLRIFHACLLRLRSGARAETPDTVATPELFEETNG